MKRQQLISSLVFWSGLAILLFIIQYILLAGVQWSPYAQYNKVNRIVSDKEDFNVVFFGSSVGEVGIDVPVIEEVTGRECYNFCIDGTRFLQYCGMVEEFNNYSEKGQLVVMTETFFTLSAVDQLTEPDRFAAHLDSKLIYQSLSAIQPDLVFKMKYVPFYRFIISKHSFYKASALGWQSRITGKMMSDSLDGYTPKFKNWEVNLDSINQHSEPLAILIDSATVERYKQTLSKITEKGRKVLIIIPPIHKDGLRLLPDLDKLRNTLTSLSGDQVYFIDFSNSPLSEEKKWFYNNSHLNAAGAREFSRVLGDSINTLVTGNKHKTSL